MFNFIKIRGFCIILMWPSEVLKKLRVFLRCLPLKDGLNLSATFHLRYCMSPDEINFQAYKYAEAHLPTLESICQPLSDLKIQVFAYFRFFNDGRYLYLCNHLEWLKFCLQHVHSNDNTSLGKEIGLVGHDEYHCFLWPTRCEDYLLSALYEHDIWNGLSIFKQRDDSVELWGFASHRQATDLQSFYIENLELLKKFTGLFNNTAANLILPSSSNLAIYKDFTNSDALLDDYESKWVFDFINATPLTKYPLLHNNKEIFLSKREMQCTHLLAMGKSVKQMALALEMSDRTVAKHLENIKKKFEHQDRSQLIQIYKDSILNWL